MKKKKLAIPRWSRSINNVPFSKVPSLSSGFLFLFKNHSGSYTLSGQWDAGLRQSLSLFCNFPRGLAVGNIYTSTQDARKGRSKTTRTNGWKRTRNRNHSKVVKEKSLESSVGRGKRGGGGEALGGGGRGEWGRPNGGLSVPSGADTLHSLATANSSSSRSSKAAHWCKEDAAGIWYEEARRITEEKREEKGRKAMKPADWLREIQDEVK